MAAVEPTTVRQIALYEDTCDIWQPAALTYVSSTTGEPNDTTYTKIASSQKCYFFTKTETAEPEVIGRMGRDIIFTLDWLKMPSACVIDDTCVVKLTTVGHPHVNTFWRVEGDVQKRMSRSRRKPDFTLVYVKRLPAAPSGVT
jgi:hypothetical protein